MWLVTGREHAEEQFRLVLRWAGGSGEEKVELVHNGARVEWHSRIVEASRGATTIEYTAFRVETHRVQVRVSFLGEQRTDLSAACFIDARQLSPVVRTEAATHRWEIDQLWTDPDAKKPVL